MSNCEMTRREREKLRQRTEMLAAARDLFAEKGFHNVSMHEIAAKAEFAIGTLYSFFNNKEDIYHTIVQDLAETFHEALREVLEGSENEIEKLRNYIRVKTDVLDRNLSFIRMFINEARGGSNNVGTELNIQLRTQYHETLKLLAFVFENGMKHQIFERISEPYHLAVALDSTTNSLLLFYLDNPATHQHLDNPDIILNIFFKSLLQHQVSG